MFKLKQSLVAFAGLTALVILIALVTASSGRGQGSSGNAPPPSDVNVVNPATNPALVRDVDRPPAQPYQSTVQVLVPVGERSGTGALDAVPAGKRLVVEYATARVSLAPDHLATVGLVVGGVRYELPVIPQGTVTSLLGPANALLSGSEPVRLYVDAGGSVGVVVSQTDDDFACLVNVSISGHLVNVP